ncbi:MAG: PRC-barrel domain-containing protein [Patescibacteria group bacterium]
MLRDSQLRGLPVFTKSGGRVGKVSGFVLDPAAHSVSRYLVRRGRSLSRLLPEELAVSPVQVVSLDEEKMVVIDAVIAVEARAAIELPETIAGAISGMSARIE